MTMVDSNGMLTTDKVVSKRFLHIEHGNLTSVKAIVVHQTDAPTAKHTFNAYNSGGNGAHFLIAKDGLIYQTASLKKRCYHVGRRIKPKCITVNPKACDPKKLEQIMKLSWGKRVVAIDSNERKKSYPERYPVNSDLVGIELVGKHISETSYEAVTHNQNESLKLLIKLLHGVLNTTEADIYNHPEVSYKHPGEASTAAW